MFNEIKRTLILPTDTVSKQQNGIRAKFSIRYRILKSINMFSNYNVSQI